MRDGEFFVMHIGEWAGTIIVVVLLVCFAFIVVSMCEEPPPPCQCEGQIE